MDPRFLNKILAIVTVVFGALAFVSPAAADLTYQFTSGTDVAVTGSNYVASGPLSVSLGFAPTPGTNLTVVKNTGLPFISGTFDSVPEGGTVSLTYNGVTYNYIANYYGGNGRSLVLQWPCTGLVAWGSGNSGELGNNSTSDSSVPVAVSTSGAMASKTVVAIAGGGYHSLALTSGGQVFAWGQNNNGQLGNNSTADSPVPAAVSAGVMAGKIVVAIAAGRSHSLALTSDGKVFAWGDNLYGELGNNSTSNSSVAVSAGGALAGKTVVAIAAGGAHSLALTSDGQLFSWGDNSDGQLGNSSTDESPVPVRVYPYGVLAGKTVVAIAAGCCHSVALTLDGQVFAWGHNLYGELGNNSTNDSDVPVAVDVSGVMAGKTIAAIAAGCYHSIALTSDGQIFSWGYNYDGELGNNSQTGSSVPVLVSASGGLSTKIVVAVAGGDWQGMAVTSDGQVFDWGQNEFGELGNGSTLDSAVPVAVSGNGDGALVGKAVMTVAAGGSHALAMFGSGPPIVTTNPVVHTDASGTTAMLIASATDNFPISVQWQVSTTGTLGPFSDITDNATAQTGTMTLTNVTSAQNSYAYRAVFTNNAGFSTTTAVTFRVNVQATFASSTDIPVTTNSLFVSGSLTAVLAFAPPPGTNLTVINNTGLGFINGTFSNVPQGGVVPLSYGGVTYNYIANYYGGNGRSLVLQWPCTGLNAWGSNNSGQLGDNDTTDTTVPVGVNASGVLRGKTVVAIAGGGSHSLALTSDGGIFAWGCNSNGQLGNSGTANSSAAVAVATNGILAGKTVIAIAAGGGQSVGDGHSLALTSDGQVYAWGCNYYGQLGNNSTTDSSVPVAVTANGALSGKTVVAIAAGACHSLAMTSDGQVFAWGDNSYGQLGNNGVWHSWVPIAVTASTGGLAGKTVVAIAGGSEHSLALTSDGEVVAWGVNVYGQLGNNSPMGSTTPVNVPVAVSTSGVLAGKMLTAIAAGGGHSLALSADGQVYAWGSNFGGELGNNSNSNSPVPVAVSASGALSGKTVAAIAAGNVHCAALTEDGQVFAWGGNGAGQLGSGNTMNSSVPVGINASGSLAGEKAAAIAAGLIHNLALFCSGPPSVTANPVSQTVVQTGTSAVSVTFTGAVAQNPAPGVQWQVSTTGTDGIFTNIVDNVTAATGTLTLTNVTQEQNGYAYRAVFTNSLGNCTTDAATLTLVNCPNLQTTFSSGTDAPVTANNVYVSGSLTVVLGFAPTPGTNLTVINNTGMAFINGAFSNVPQGGRILLNYQGTTYKFTANYYGGNGRSLVLQWPCVGVDTWGANGYGQLGNNSTSNSSVPVAMSTSGALAGKTVIAVAAGGNHSLALTSDGQVYGWGYNSNGQLGNNSTTNSSVPVPVSINGVLAGKTVVAISAGYSYSLALTSDGQVFAWGYNYDGELGNGDQSGTSSSVPVAINASGALAGKTVVAISAGDEHGLALTSDGQVYAWGYNYYGQLGAGTINSTTPVAVNTSGVMAGKTVVAIAAGHLHSLALTSDGQVFAWGENNWWGELGNNSATNSSVPVAVSTSGVLAGKTVCAIAAGGAHSMALTSDDQLVAWGEGDQGQLGNNSTTNSPVTVAVSTSGALAGETVIALATGGNHSLALTSAGQVFAWGCNSSGQLGNNRTANSSVPVAVTTSGSLLGKAVVAIAGGGDHTIAMFDSGAPSVTANPASQTVLQIETLGATVNFSAAATDIFPFTIQWQVSTTGTAGPFSNISGNATSTTGTLTLSNVTLAQNGYAYRAVFTNDAGSSTTTAAALTVLSGQDLQVTFNSGTDVPVTANSVSVSGSLTVALNFVPALGTNLTVINNTGQGPISGNFSNVPQGGTVQLSYNGTTYNYIANYSGGNGRSLVFQWKAVDLLATFTSATDVPVTTNGNIYVSGSLTVALNFAPPPGTNLTVIKNAGPGFISGVFSNVIQGGTVPVTYNGVTYNYIATYYGGNGRSLILRWPCKEVDVWGRNDYGQLGNSGTTNSLVPVAVYSSGVLPGPKVVAISGGGYHTLALTLGGQVFAWGYNNYGQLGNSGTASSSVPVAVYPNGALAGKTVVAISGGGSHSLALTSAGQVYAWGYNNYGQLGNSGTTNSSVPVAVYPYGALNEKTVLAIAGGTSHSLALTSDGQVFAWGYNNYGQLGNSGTASSSVPVVVSTTGALAGKTVVAISGGASHSLALTSDGQVFAWGYNNYGQLGNSSMANSSVPVAVSTTGALAGKTVVAIAGGGSHSLALTSDGQVYAWGFNWYGQLGNFGSSYSSVPVAVYTNGPLYGKTVVAIAAGSLHSLALTSDGLVFCWGYNADGELGNNSTGSSNWMPWPVTTSGVMAGEKVISLSSGYFHSVTTIAWGPPSVVTNPVNQPGTSGAAVSFSATAATDNSPTPTVQWQVSTTGTAGTFSNIVGNATATTTTLTLTNVTPTQNGYAYRAVFTNNAGSSTTTAATLTVYSSPPVLTIPGNITVSAASKDGAVVDYKNNVTANDNIDGAIIPVCAPPPGSIFAIGTTTVNCSATNSGGLIATGSFTVTVRRTFASFQDQHGLLDPDPTADPNHAGVCQLAAYAFGVNPSAPDRSQLPTTALQDGYLQITYPQWINAADLSYFVEVSGDLMMWYSGAAYTVQVSSSPDPNDATRQWVVVRDLIPTSTVPRRFIRVRITH